MRKLLYIGLVCFWGMSAPAQTLIDSWTYDGGGLDPASYGGNYKPESLNPDAGADSGASIAVSGYGAATGLGSSSYPDGYGYFYTMFSTTVNFSLGTTNVLDGAETITLTLWSGGNTAWSESFLTLNYNAGNTAVAASSYSAVTGTVTEYGAVTYYTWVWSVSGLGESSGFSIEMPLAMHTPVGDIILTQAVPEPSTWLLLAVTGAGLILIRFRSKRRASC